MNGVVAHENGHTPSLDETDHMRDDVLMTEADRIYQKKVQWAKDMRLMFSVPEMLHSDGIINQSYFKPQRLDIFDRSTLLSWGEQQDRCLLKGIIQYGIHDWSSIVINYLPNWDAKALRTQAIRLIGATCEEDFESTYLTWKEENKNVDTAVSKAASMRSLSNAGTTKRRAPAPPKLKPPKPPRALKPKKKKLPKAPREPKKPKPPKELKKKENDKTFHSSTRVRYVQPSNRTLRTRKRVNASINIYDFMDFDD